MTENQKKLWNQLTNLTLYAKSLPVHSPSGNGFLDSVDTLIKRALE